MIICAVERQNFEIVPQSSHFDFMCKGSNDLYSRFTISTPH